MVSWHQGSTDSQMGRFVLSLQVTSGTVLSTRCKWACIIIVADRVFYAHYKSVSTSHKLSFIHKSCLIWRDYNKCSTETVRLQCTVSYKHSLCAQFCPLKKLCFLVLLFLQKFNWLLPSIRVQSDTLTKYYTTARSQGWIMGLYKVTHRLLWVIDN